MKKEYKLQFLRQITGRWSDLILGLERASLQGHLLVFLWIISALVLKRSMEFEPLSPQTLLHICCTQIWLSRSRLFLKLFVSIFSVRLSSTIDLLKDAFTETSAHRLSYSAGLLMEALHTGTVIQSDFHCCRKWSRGARGDDSNWEIGQTKSHDSITPHICLVCIVAATCSSAGLDSDWNTVLATSLNATDVDTLHTCCDCLWRNSEAY